MQLRKKSVYQIFFCLFDKELFMSTLTRTSITSAFQCKYATEKKLTQVNHQFYQWSQACRWIRKWSSHRTNKWRIACLQIKDQTCRFSD